MNKKYSSKFLIVCCVASFALATLAFTLFLGFKTGGKEGLAATMKFAEVYKIIDKRYIGESDMEEISNYAYQTMVMATEDRWSYYMTEEEYDEYKLMQDNVYLGVGISLGKNEAGEIYIASVTKNSPADKAGILLDELVLKIDGEDITEFSTSEIAMIIGAMGEKKFELTLLDTEGNEKTVSLAREIIFTDPVTFEIIEENIGYVKIANFEKESGANAISAIEEMKENGASKFIIDVRGNFGGYKSEMLELLDFLCPKGDLQIALDREGNEEIDKSDEDFLDMPLAILVNEQSYSAAEFTAAALMEYELATVVGFNTTGKARSQVNIELSDGSCVHISTAVYLTPNRVDLAEQGGLVPDIVVEISDEEKALFNSGMLEFGEDKQLQAAISALN